MKGMFYRSRRDWCAIACIGRAAVRPDRTDDPLLCTATRHPSCRMAMTYTTLPSKRYAVNSLRPAIDYCRIFIRLLTRSKSLDWCVTILEQDLIVIGMKR